MARIEQFPKTQERKPPVDFSVEQGLLGAILSEERLLEAVIDAVKPEMFFDPVHAEAFRKAVEFYTAGQKPTPFLVGRSFGPDPLPIQGAPNPSGYFGSLAMGRTVADATTAKAYAEILSDLWRRRMLIALAEPLIAEAYNVASEQSATQICESVEADVYAIRQTTPAERRAGDIGSAFGEVLSMANEARMNGGTLCGIGTGIGGLDAALGGLRPGTLLIIAGRPGMGKSALGVSIAYNVAASGKHVAFASLEMSSAELATRVLARVAQLDTSSIMRGDLTEDQFRAMHDTAAKLKQLPLSIDDTGGLSVGQLAGRALRMKRQGKLDLLVVDYLQLMRGSARRSNENRVQEVTEITNGLKALAKELEVPVVALSQLSRNVENRENKRPQLSDLRESGSIEQDADAVMFVFREEYYLAREQPSVDDAKFFEWQAAFRACEGRAEIIVAKNRQGATSTVNLAYHAPTTTFYDAPSP